MDRGAPTRRDAVKLLGAAGAALLLPRGARAAPAELAAPSFPWSRRLVLVQLAGGNDGLNTVVPHADPAYRRLRPRLAVPSDRVLRLTDELGLHPRLEPLMRLWRAKEMTIALGVGHEPPNRSHFRSIDIWETGSAPHEVLDTGWLARELSRHEAPPGLVAHGLLLGRSDPGPLRGPGVRAVALQRPQRFLRRARGLDAAGGRSVGASNPALAHVLRVRDQVEDSAAAIESHLAAAPEIETPFPETALGAQLELAARLACSGALIPSYVVTHRGYDTHARQVPLHERLLGELAEALVAFRDALKERGEWERTVVVTYSEFGRRPAENGSGGTDHGTAAPHFVLGARRTPWIGAQPRLASTLERVIDPSVLWREALRSG